MLTRLRATLYRAMTTPRGDAFAPVRWPKDLARRLNATVGSPLATRGELEARLHAQERLAALRSLKDKDERKDAARPPILVYFEKDRNVRELQRIEELLGTLGLTWTRLDVGGDEATIDFVVRKSGCARDDLPVVFVADRAMGNHAELVRANTSGELARALGC